MSENPPTWPPPPSGGGGYGDAPPPGGGDPYGGPPARPPFEAPAAIGYGWRAFTQNPWPFVLLTLLTVVVGGGISLGYSVSTGALSGAMNQPQPGQVGQPGAPDMSSAMALSFSFGGILVNLVTSLISTLLAAAMARGALDTLDGRKPGLGDFFSRVPWLQVVLAALITSVVSSIGFVLCILPGLVVLLFTMFTSYAIIDRNLNAIEGLQTSIKLVASNFGPALLFGVLAVLVVIAGFCALFLGLLVAVPIVTIATAFAYRILSGYGVAGPA